MSLIKLKSLSFGLILTGLATMLLVYFLAYSKIKTYEREIVADSRWASIAENNNIGRWKWLVDEDRLTWSENMFPIFGVSQTSMPQNYEDFESRVHPSDREWVSKTVSEAIRDKGSYHAVFRTSTNPVRYVRAYGHINPSSPTVFSGICVEASESEYSGAPESILGVR